MRLHEGPNPVIYNGIDITAKNQKLNRVSKRKFNSPQQFKDKRGSVEIF